MLASEQPYLRQVIRQKLGKNLCVGGRAGHDDAVLIEGETAA